MIDDVKYSIKKNSKGSHNFFFSEGGELKSQSFKTLRKRGPGARNGGKDLSGQATKGSRKKSSSLNGRAIKRGEGKGPGH